MMDMGSCCKLISNQDSSSVYKHIINGTGDSLCGLNTEEKAKVSLFLCNSIDILKFNKVLLDQFWCSDKFYCMNIKNAVQFTI